MILGLTLPKLIGAIVMGMILSCVMVMIFSPQDEKSKVDQQSVQVTSEIWDVEKLVRNMIDLMIFVTFSAVVIAMTLLLTRLFN